MSTPIVIADQDVRVAITLASITYLAEGHAIEIQQCHMKAALEQTSLPTAGKWQILWGPWKHLSNLWYVAVGPNAQGVRTAAIVIRGTQMKNIDRIHEDFDLPLAPVPWIEPRLPILGMVGHGFVTAYHRLLKATDGAGKTAFDFVATLGSDTVIDVVGHSLGGAMAPLMALYAKKLFPNQVVRSFPFGGQTTGNKNFVQWYASTFAGQPALRWINHLDTIWMALANIPRIEALYGPDGPKCPDLAKAILEKYLQPHANDYADIPKSAVLNGKLYKLLDWAMEASSQHQHLYYMYLCGVPETVIRERLNPDWYPPWPRSRRRKAKGSTKSAKRSARSVGSSRSPAKRTSRQRVDRWRPTKSTKKK